VSFSLEPQLIYTDENRTVIMHFALMARARLSAMQIDRALEMSGHAVAQLVEALR